jgi:hypothetical protein
VANTLALSRQSCLRVTSGTVTTPANAGRQDCLPRRSAECQLLPLIMAPSSGVTNLALQALLMFAVGARRARH